MELFRFCFLSLCCFSHFGIFFSGWQFMVLTWNISPEKQTWQSEENSRYRVCVFYTFLVLLSGCWGWLQVFWKTKGMSSIWTMKALWIELSYYFSVEQKHLSPSPTSSLPVIKAEDMSMHSHQISPTCQRIKAYNRKPMDEVITLSVLLIIIEFIEIQYFSLVCTFIDCFWAI